MWTAASAPSSRTPVPRAKTDTPPTTSNTQPFDAPVHEAGHLHVTPARSRRRVDSALTPCSRGPPRLPGRASELVLWWRGRDLNLRPSGYESRRTGSSECQESRASTLTCNFARRSVHHVRPDPARCNHFGLQNGCTLMTPRRHGCWSPLVASVRPAAGSGASTRRSRTARATSLRRPGGGTTGSP